MDCFLEVAPWLTGCWTTVQVITGLLQHSTPRLLSLFWEKRASLRNCLADHVGDFYGSKSTRLVFFCIFLLWKGQ